MVIRLCGSAARLCTLIAAIGAGLISTTDAYANPAPSIESEADKTLDATKDILDMDLEQLARAPVVVPSMDIPVTSVAKEKSTVGRSAAAIFVITNEMIRRSGATTIPEALRMAPGMDVAQINSSTWAISARGFNSSMANKLLVLIDGRSVYTPVFSGVYWDVEDVVIEDVERIEVIRGPGGTLWGANAVNGVINIITKRAADTQGVYIGGIGGSIIHSQEVARYGGQIGEDWKYRVYGKYFDRGQFYDPNQPARDSWNQGRVGFRADWRLEPDEPDNFTIQGEHYVGNTGSMGTFSFPWYPYFETKYGNTYNTGEHLLARYRHVVDKDCDWSVQTYFDNFQRDTLLNADRVRTWDLEFQHRFLLGDGHQITCGAGYRYIHDNLPSNTEYFRSIPTDRSYYIANQFIQDEITLYPDRLQLILGCKIEQNSYTNFEYQPSIRALYTPDRRHTIWGAMSRAVHTPSRIDEDMFVESFWGFSPFGPTYGFLMIGNPDEKSEVLLAYELGYRAQASEKFSWDLATFYNNYDELTTSNYIGAVGNTIIYQMSNQGRAYSYGVELAGNYAVSDAWKLQLQYTYLNLNISNGTFYGNGYSPRNQVYLHSSWNLSDNLDFDLVARYVDSLGDLYGLAPDYIEMDLRLAWRPRESMEVAVVGRDLLQQHHYEFIQDVNYFSRTCEVPRSVYGTVTWRY